MQCSLLKECSHHQEFPTTSFDSEDADEEDDEEDEDDGEEEYVVDGVAGCWYCFINRSAKEKNFWTSSGVTEEKMLSTLLWEDDDDDDDNDEFEPVLIGNEGE